MEKKPEQQAEPNKEPVKNYVKYSSMVMQMIATIALGAFAGVKLDQYFEVKSHLFTIGLLLFSVIASIYYVIRSLMK
ncbi:MAG: AtpZ/AtpI family protein [Cytophagaceae bacterium]|nr:AtpZ/AtpI family protein [Cytophagaceae bacterium]